MSQSKARRLWAAFAAVAMVLLSAIFAVPAQASVAPTEPPSAVSGFVYDPTNVLGGNVSKLNGRLYAMSKRGVYVYVAFVTSYDNMSGLDWNQEVLKQANAPSNSYVFSVSLQSNTYSTSAGDKASLTQTQIQQIGARPDVLQALNSQNYYEAADDFAVAIADALGVDPSPSALGSVSWTSWIMVGLVAVVLVIFVIWLVLYLATNKKKNPGKKKDRKKKAKKDKSKVEVASAQTDNTNGQDYYDSEATMDGGMPVVAAPVQAVKTQVEPQVSEPVQPAAVDVSFAPPVSEATEVKVEQPAGEVVADAAPASAPVEPKPAPAVEPIGFENQDLFDDPHDYQQAHASFNNIVENFEAPDADDVFAAEPDSYDPDVIEGDKPKKSKGFLGGLFGRKKKPKKEAEPEFDYDDSDNPYLEQFGYGTEDKKPAQVDPYLDDEPVEIEFDPFAEDEDYFGKDGEEFFTEVREIGGDAEESVPVSAQVDSPAQASPEVESYVVEDQHGIYNPEAEEYEDYEDEEYEDYEEGEYEDDEYYDDEEYEEGEYEDGYYEDDEYADDEYYDDEYYEDDEDAEQAGWADDWAVDAQEVESAAVAPVAEVADTAAQAEAERKAAEEAEAARLAAEKAEAERKAAEEAEAARLAAEKAEAERKAAEEAEAARLAAEKAEAERKAAEEAEAARLAAEKAEAERKAAEEAEAARMAEEQAAAEKAEAERKAAEEAEAARLAEEQAAAEKAEAERKAAEEAEAARLAAEKAEAERKAAEEAEAARLAEEQAAAEKAEAERKAAEEAAARVEAEKQAQAELAAMQAAQASAGVATAAVPVVKQTDTKASPAEESKPEEPKASTGGTAQVVSLKALKSVPKEFLEALSDTDDLVRTSHEDLKLAQKQLGKSATVPFMEALADTENQIRLCFAYITQMSAQTKTVDINLIARKLQDPSIKLHKQATTFANTRHSPNYATDLLFELRDMFKQADRTLGQAGGVLKRLSLSLEAGTIKELEDDIENAKELMEIAKKEMDQASSANSIGKYTEAVKHTRIVERNLLDAMAACRRLGDFDAYVRAQQIRQSAPAGNSPEEITQRLEATANAVIAYMTTVDDFVNVRRSRIGVETRVLLGTANSILGHADKLFDTDPQKALAYVLQAEAVAKQAQQAASADVA